MPNERLRGTTVRHCVRSRKLAFTVLLLRHVTVLRTIHTIHTMDENRLTSLTIAPRCAASATRRRQDGMVAMSGEGEVGGGGMEGEVVACSFALRGVEEYY